MSILNPPSPRYLSLLPTTETYAGTAAVTNRDALSGVMDKLRRYPREDTHILFVGDSITAGFNATVPWQQGWAGQFTSALKQVAGDGGTYIPARRREDESGVSRVSNNEALPWGGNAPATGGPWRLRRGLYGWDLTDDSGGTLFGWSASAARNGFGGYQVYPTGTASTAMEFHAPPCRYVEPVVVKRASGTGTLRFTIDGVATDVETLDAGLAADLYNHLTSIDTGEERSRVVQISQVTSGSPYIEGVRLRRERRGVIDYNLGWSGLKIADLASRFTTDEARHAYVGAGCVTPDLIVICLGYNDYGSTAEATAAAQMADFVNAVKTINGETIPILYVMYPPGSSDGTQAARQSYYSAIKDSAVATGAEMCVVDLYSMGGDWLNVSSATAAGLYDAADSTHPTIAGHSAWAKELLAAIEAPTLPSIGLQA